jgi:hypothetical protein
VLVKCHLSRRVSLGSRGKLEEIGVCIRDFACACQGDAHTAHRYRLWVGEDELSPQLGLMRLGRLSIEDNKGRIRPGKRKVSLCAPRLV